MLRQPLRATSGVGNLPDFFNLSRLAHPADLRIIDAWIFAAFVPFF
jgi:hypothetical protein